MKETRRLVWEEVRTLCIKDDYYTKGNNGDYENLLFNLCSESNVATLELIEEVATDILEHSDVCEKMYKYGCGYDELKVNLMSCLVNECCYTFIE